MNPLKALVKTPKRLVRLLRMIETYQQGYQTAKTWPQTTSEPGPVPKDPFSEYFDKVQTGPGIWKWTHYFEIYHRHFEKFIGQPEVNVLEIGVYSGGSMEMWRQVFGAGCRVYGVDIEPSCRAYERDNVHILIGDQGDRKFWQTIRQEVPPLDIVIDDGGHLPDQQIVTLEESLPLLKPGGVFLCEDIQHPLNRFLLYLAGFAGRLNASDPYLDGPEGPTVPANGLQNLVKSVTIYPYVAVVETRDQPIGRLTAPRRGSQWQPFYENRDSPASVAAMTPRV